MQVTGAGAELANRRCSVLESGCLMLLSVNGLGVSFAGEGRSRLRAVNDVSFSLNRGEILGIVGESGCGKSTLAKTLVRLIEADAGEVWFRSQDVLRLDRRAMKMVRRDIQIVFQDPFGSLNPRHTVAQILQEPLQVHRIGNRQEQVRRVHEMLETVGLNSDALTRRAHEFSGGQRQRIAIARALILKPKILVADEAVSALDVSVQSQIINLISELRAQFELSILFISHDLSVIRHVSDRIAVMYLGRIVEIGAAAQVMDHPQHPYTQALISAIPALSAQQTSRIVLHGELPDPANPPPGCSFSTRCPEFQEICARKRPALLAHAGNPGAGLTGAHLSACHLVK